MAHELLIVEDNVAEAIYAQAEAAKAGFKEFTLATNLEEALKAIPTSGAVTSDLFFPAGNISTEVYSKRFLPFYEDYKTRRFLGARKDTIVLRAVEACAECFGVTPSQYIEDYMAKMATPKSVLNAARDAVRGITDSANYDKLQTIISQVREGSNLPLGIIVVEEAQKIGIPAVIVTSTNHHSLAFEPVRSLITVPYADNLIEGKKDWAGGLARLVGGNL